MLRINRLFTILPLVALVLSACQPIVAPVEPATMALPDGGAIVQTNDVETYYEIHGAGEPLLFMPGDFRSTEDVADLTELLAKEYQVIVMDPRGRGRSSDSEAPLTMALMADDAVALLDKLGIKKAHVVGWASSAVVGLDLAMRYPERVNKLVLQGPNYTVDGLAPDHLAWFEALVMEEMVPRFEEQYNRTAPNPAYLLTMLNRFQELLLREPNYTVEMLNQIQAPTLVIDGDLDDWIVREHLETLAATIPNGQLVLLPELTHFAPFEDATAWTDAVLAFLNEPVVATAQIVPRFEPTACKYPVLADANAECGYLIVPEDRNNPDSSTIKVHVIKFLSASDNPAPDPVIVIPGGPGSSGPAYSWFVSALPFGEAMRQDRDVYVLETRGAMYSEPAFYCPETEADVAELVGMSMAEEVDWSAKAYQACHDRLVDEGVDLSAYGFLDIAGDVADLRTALGVDEVNVYGVSYGTTPAMLLMRDSPEWLRSVILDSIIPPDVVYLEHVLENITAALDNTFVACTADPVCNGAYPNLDSIFADLLAQLRAEPVEVTVSDDAGVEHTVTVDDVKFVHFAYESIFIGDGYTTLPAGIYAAHNGDLQAPAETWLGYVAGQHGAATAEAGAWAKGMTYSAMCLQDGSVTDLATVTAIYDQVDTLPSIRDWGVTHMLGEWFVPCEYWAVTPPEPNIATDPVESDLPTLMVGGLFDPEAPPMISREAAERFSNGYAYELPAAHGLLFMDCAVNLMTQFLADPSQAPDASCIDAMTPNWVLPE